MKLSRRLPLLLTFVPAALLSSGLAHAACFSYYCTDTVGLIISDSTGVSLSLSNGLGGLTNCTPSNGIYLRVPKSDPNYASHYAMLLAAKIADRAISFRPVDNSPDCSIGYVYLQ
jgi:hypothetical protein